jgi:uridine phosphorylase
MGTSGGLGLPAGSLVVSTEALDGQLKPEYRNVILGKVRTGQG